MGLIVSSSGVPRLDQTLADLIREWLPAELALFTDLKAVLIANELVVRWIAGALLERRIVAKSHTRLFSARPVIVRCRTTA